MIRSGHLREARGKREEKQKKTNNMRTCRRQCQHPLARGRRREAQSSKIVAARRIHVKVCVGTGSASLGPRDRVHVSRCPPIKEDARSLTIADEDTGTRSHIDLVALEDTDADENVAVAEHAYPSQEAG